MINERKLDFFKISPQIRVNFKCRNYFLLLPPFTRLLKISLKKSLLHVFLVRQSYRKKISLHVIAINHKNLTKNTNVNHSE